MPYTFFKFNVNLICLVICTVITTTETKGEVVFPALLDASKKYKPDKTLYFTPRRDDRFNHVLEALVFIHYNLAIVLLASMNLTKKSVVIQKIDVLENKIFTSVVCTELTINKQANL